jgi:hypothetical protein
MALVVGVVLLAASACSSDGGGGKKNSVAYKLAVIDGDASEQSDFQKVIDCIMASGIKGAETEEKVGDTLVASWQAGGKRGSLLQWGRTLCSA